MELGKLLNELDKVYENKPIVFRKGYTLLSDFHSYRGDYSQLAIEYSEEPNQEFTVRDFKELLDRALDKGTMEGYKGGDYDIDEDTEVVLASYGDSGGYAIAEFIEREDDVYMAVADL